MHSETQPIYYIVQFSLKNNKEMVITRKNYKSEDC